VLWKTTIFKFAFEIIIVNMVLVSASDEDHQIIVTIW
jgi:hypothetical protein